MTWCSVKKKHKDNFTFTVTQCCTPSTSQREAHVGFCVGDNHMVVVKSGSSAL